MYQIHDVVHQPVLRRATEEISASSCQLFLCRHHTPFNVVDAGVRLREKQCISS
ncbi:MAG: hypothetical protein N0C78_15135 [Candidatus Thiodiazotropha taylori]|nr:hypothetical protein [Candidatus Thiodiazotropha taylori]